MSYFRETLNIINPASLSWGNGNLWYHICRGLKPNYGIVRSSHQRYFTWKSVLRNFAKFTGKHLCQSPFFNKVAGLRLLLDLSLWFHCSGNFLQGFLIQIILFILQKQWPGGVPYKDVFIKFTKLTWAGGLWLYRKGNSGTGVSYEFCDIFKSTYTIFL